MNASGQLFVFIYLTALEKKLLVKFSDGFKGGKPYENRDFGSKNNSLNSS